MGRTTVSFELCWSFRPHGQSRCFTQEVQASDPVLLPASVWSIQVRFLVPPAAITTPSQSFWLDCSSHLQENLSDPSIGDKFSVEKLGSAGRGLVSVPSIVHGAPETAEVCLRMYMVL